MPKDYQGDKVLELNKQVIKLTEDVKVRGGLLAQMASETGNEIVRLRSRIHELETSTYCAYCGEKYPLDDKAASAVSEHIKTCKKHPMRKLEEEWDAKATSYRVELDALLFKNAELRKALSKRGVEMNDHLIVTIPNGNQYHIDLIHQIEQAIAKALVPSGFAHTGTSHGDEVVIKYYQFGRCPSVEEAK